MENAITADAEKIKHHIYYDILQNLYEKHKDNSDSKLLIEKIQQTAQELLDVKFTKKKYKVDPLWVSLVYNEDNKDIINNAYRSIVKEVTSKLDIELVVNPTEEKLTEINKSRQNYFVMTDSTFSDLIQTLEENNKETGIGNPVILESNYKETKAAHPIITQDNYEEVRTANAVIVEQLNKASINPTAVGISDMLLVTEMEEVPFNEAAHYMYHLGSIENSPFKSIFKEQPIISLPLIENSLLLSLAGRSNLLVYEVENILELNLNQESHIADKIKNLRDESFNSTSEVSNDKKLS